MRHLAVFLVLAFAGCLSPAPAPVAPTCPLGSSVVGIPFDVDLPFASLTDPNQPWDGLVLQDASSAGALTLTTSTGWTASTVPLSNGTGPHLERVRVRGGAGAPASGIALGWDSAGADLCPTKNGLRADLASPIAGEIAAAGKGVQAYTAGFWENGTLFYTNIEAIDASPWPRAGWYAWEGSAALPVYVYDQDRTEQGPEWSGCTPRDGPIGRSCASGYPGYFTTIEGFNEGLKGLSTMTSRVVWMPPEKAYTVPGAEESPLYGDALIFYIQIRSVEDMPCPAGAPAGLCDLPGAG